MFNLYTNAESIFIMLKCCTGEQQLFMWRVQKTMMTICLVHDYSQDYAHSFWSFLKSKRQLACKSHLFLSNHRKECRMDCVLFRIYIFRTVRMLFPECIRSKALLIWSKDRLPVTNSSTFIFLDIYSDTSFGTLSTLFHPKRNHILLENVCNKFLLYA